MFLAVSVVTHVFHSDTASVGMPGLWESDPIQCACVRASFNVCLCVCVCVRERERERGREREGARGREEERERAREIQSPSIPGVW